MRAAPILAAAMLSLVAIALTPAGAATNCLGETPATNDACFDTDHHGCVGKVPKCKTHCVSVGVDPKVPGAWYSTTGCAPGTENLGTPKLNADAPQLP